MGRYADWRSRGLIPLLLSLAVLLGPRVAVSAPIPLTDDEMDHVSASGGLTIDLENNGDTTKFGFSFDLGGTNGVGSVALSPMTSVPSTLTSGGSGIFSNNLFNVENMIFNLNICVQCSGTIFQAGIGIPIRINGTQ
jgi:hypothetical protein